MNGKTARPCASWLLPSLLATTLVLTAGCASKAANCYAEAVPASGEGGLAWGSTVNMASKKSMDSCALYASRSGGTPSSCHVVLAQCKK
jgi:hypothetical protein